MFHKNIIGYFFWALLCSSCFFFNKTSKHSNTIMSRQEVNEALKIHLKTNSLVNWDSISDELMYSMAMLSDSIVRIVYTPISGDKSLYAYQFDTLPKEWLDKRDEFIQFVLEEERKYRNMSELEIRHIVHYRLSDMKLNKYPGLTFRITSPFIIPELRKNPFVRDIIVYYPVHDVFFLEDY